MTTAKPLTYYLINYSGRAPSEPMPFGKDRQVSIKQARIFVESMIRRRLDLRIKDEENRIIFHAHKGTVKSPQNVEAFWKLLEQIG